MENLTIECLSKVSSLISCTVRLCCPPQSPVSQVPLASSTLPLQYVKFLDKSTREEREPYYVWRGRERVDVCPSPLFKEMCEGFCSTITDPPVTSFQCPASLGVTMKVGRAWSIGFACSEHLELSDQIRRRKVYSSLLVGLMQAQLLAMAKLGCKHLHNGR